MRLQGYAVLDRDAVCGLASCDAAQLAALAPGWDDLALDTYLRDGGRYRRRRHACFVQDADTLVQAPHRAHWQSQDYNALHGGMHRWFEPVADATLAQPAWAGLIQGFGKLLKQLGVQSRWYVEAHQFRIDTTDGIARDAEGRIGTGWILWSYCWWTGWASRAVRPACSRPRAPRASASPWTSRGRRCCWTMRA